MNRPLTLHSINNRENVYFADCCSINYIKTLNTELRECFDLRVTFVDYFVYFSTSEVIGKTNLFIFILKLEQSLVSLDLGGGSTQITFYPRSNRVEGLEGRKHFLHDVNVLQNLIKVSQFCKL